MRNHLATSTEKKEKSASVNALVTTEAIVKDPVGAKGYQQFQALNLFLDTLVRKDPTIGLISGISNGWEISEDKKVYVFEIDQNSKFHDTAKVSAADVVTSFKRHLTKDSKSSVGSYLRNVVDTVKADKAGRVVFELYGPYPPFLELLSMAGFGIHKVEPDGNILGTGPYQFLGITGKTTCLRKFADYPFTHSNIERYCFTIERSAEATIAGLISKKFNLAMGSPLEVALSPKLAEDFIDFPTFSMATTNVIFNHTNKYFLDFENRNYITSILTSLKCNPKVLTKYDSPSETYFPHGIMPPSYYDRPVQKAANRRGGAKRRLRIVLPYGIFLQSSVAVITREFEDHGFDISVKNVKGKELLTPILDGDFDLLFLPYHGVISDPDGYLDILEQNSIISKAKLPTGDFLESLRLHRFNNDKKSRLEKYSELFINFEQKFHLVPFSQNGIPIIFSRSISIPDLNSSCRLSLRDINFKNESEPT